MIAVKPQYVGTVLEEIKDILTEEHIIVSIAAGIPLSAMKVSLSPRCACAAGVSFGDEGAPPEASKNGAQPAHGEGMCLLSFVVTCSTHPSVIQGLG